MSQFTENVETLIRARYPILYVKTYEESRVSAAISLVASRVNKKVYEWSATSGFSQSYPPPTNENPKLPRSRDPIEALNQVTDQVEPAIFVFHDFHPFLSRDHFLIIRKLKEIGRFLKNSYRTVLFVSPVVELPVELEKEITVLDFPLPGRTELDQLLISISTSLEDKEGLCLHIDERSREHLVDAALGLTINEAENVFAKIIVSKRQLSSEDVGLIIDEKRQLVRKSGLLEFYPATESLETVGGLSSFKEWLGKRSLAFSQKAEAFGLRPPKGVLLLGVQGCGKSLCAKAISKAWQLPLLRFDIGRMFGSFIGASEANMRKAIDLAESIAPAVLWVDEIDKAFSGISESAGSDSGTTARVLGTFLTWLSEKESPVFVVATANSISKLPPELLRKGRLDEIFFVDLPNEEELKEVIQIHLRKRQRDPAHYQVTSLARLAKDFSGAEIEEAINSALYDAFHSETELTTEHIATAIAQTVPLAQTMDDQIKQLRSWAQGRARMAGGMPH
ncbi:AAA family ATPase [Verrucomicrobia bacterium]|jgi:SpoVK/Ycf46/Vps4 family AAA+-type ATPase|nr:AAA family ATPase [Verrucomicrobiota bacterium]MDB4746474.1 AAA family ATPase [Verrucomicrobiota bacterium]